MRLAVSRLHALRKITALIMLCLQGTTGFSFAAPPPMMGSAHRDYENVTLMRMRQAAERNKLITEMKAKEAADQ
jgi:hypothetical protein